MNVSAEPTIGWAIPPSRLRRATPCRARAPFVCYADIFPADGEINPLHKGGLGAARDEGALSPRTFAGYRNRRQEGCGGKKRGRRGEKRKVGNCGGKKRKVEDCGGNRGRDC